MTGGQEIRRKFSFGLLEKDLLISCPPVEALGKRLS
jgi:hypothetical protein